MDWRDEGILLGLRRHGESSAIIEALTKDHGRHAGLVRGGAGKSRAAMLQPGALLALEWNARLADHLGTYKVELVRSHAAAIMAGRERLAALNVISALLLRLLPERAPDAELYDSTLGLVEALGKGAPNGQRSMQGGSSTFSARSVSGSVFGIARQRAPPRILPISRRAPAMRSAARPARPMRNACCPCPNS